LIGRGEAVQDRRVPIGQCLFNGNNRDGRTEDVATPLILTVLQTVL